MSTHITDVLRPDGRLLVRSDAGWTVEAAASAVGVADSRGAVALAHIDEESSAEHAALATAGFAEWRRQAHVAISVEQALDTLAGAAPPPGIELRTAADVDEDRLRLLDDELREDVPGTSGWRSTPEEFRDHTFADPAFDPRTYLVAVDGESGEYVGLVRIWMNPEGPRLGLIAVRREQRRRGIASALIAQALEAVRASGASEVTTGYDLENVASRALFERLGVRRLSTMIELVYEPEEVEAGVG